MLRPGLVVAFVVAGGIGNPARAQEGRSGSDVDERPAAVEHAEGRAIDGRWECPMPVLGFSVQPQPGRPELAPMSWVHPPRMLQSPGFDAPRLRSTSYRVFLSPEPTAGRHGKRSLSDHRMPVLPLDCFNPLVVVPEAPPAAEPGLEGPR